MNDMDKVNLFIALGLILTALLKGFAAEFGKKLAARLSRISATTLMTISLLVMACSLSLIVIKTTGFAMATPNHKYEDAVNNLSLSNITKGICPNKYDVITAPHLNKFSAPIHDSAVNFVTELSGINIIKIKLFNDWASTSTTCKEYYQDGQFIQPEILHNIVKNNHSIALGVSNKILELLKENQPYPNPLTPVIYDNTTLNYEIVGKLLLEGNPVATNDNMVYMPIHDGDNRMVGIVCIISASKIATNSNLKFISFRKFVLSINEKVKANKISILKTTLEN